MTMPRFLVALTLIAGFTVVTLHGYSVSAYRWPTSTVRYYVNPVSKYVSSAAVISAVQTAANNWNSQTLAKIDLLYAGTTTGTALKLNLKNEVFLRNTTSSYVAKTYTYWNSKGQRIDSDIIFYEGSHRFYAFSGCSQGVYIESMATHEFGHMLGVQHSGVTGATMRSSMPAACDRTWLTLELDDRTALQKAYP